MTKISNYKSKKIHNCVFKWNLMAKQHFMIKYKIKYKIKYEIKYENVVFTLLKYKYLFLENT